MPYEIQKSGKRYTVLNSRTGEVHAKHTSLAKAKAQIRLLHGKTGHGKSGCGSSSTPVMASIRSGHGRVQHVIIPGSKLKHVSESLVAVNGIPVRKIQRRGHGFLGSLLGRTLAGTIGRAIGGSRGGDIGSSVGSFLGNFSPI